MSMAGEKKYLGTLRPVMLRARDTQPIIALIYAYSIISPSPFPPMMR